MTMREKFLKALNFQSPGEAPVMEFMGFWPETVRRWQEEGVDKNTCTFKHFDLLQMKYLPINFNFVPAYERQVFEETDEYIVVRDECNCIKKEFKNSSAMPHYMQFPIASREDFYQVKERMDPYSPERYPENWEELIEEYKNRDYPLGVFIRGPFAFCRDFIDFMDLMLMFHDDLDLIKEMMEFQTEFIIKLFERVFKDVELDFVYIGEDMAYKNGTMISPELIEEIIVPCYKKITSYFKQFNIENIFLDSDGNIEAILPLVVESGFDGILPLENAAGMDPLKIRGEYPRLKMIGGLNKLNIARGREGIDEEIQKVQILCGQGGYIPSFDHSVPPIISLDTYKTYVGELRNCIGNSVADNKDEELIRMVEEPCAV